MINSDRPPPQPPFDGLDDRKVWVILLNLSNQGIMPSRLVYPSLARLEPCHVLNLVQLFSEHPGSAWCLEEAARPLDNVRVRQRLVDVCTSLFEEFNELCDTAHDRYEGQSVGRGTPSFCCLWLVPHGGQNQNGLVSLERD